ncbi:MAG: BrnT family toxin [Acidobacteria bacterium]|nr:BrnT family toxin [Acidobacteriota bacterium]
MDRFEWDGAKAAANWRKHGVSFEEAATIFHDWNQGTWPDVLHSTNEDRFITIGLSERQRLLTVTHTDRDEIIRIISAREATRAERRRYEEDNDDSH